MAYLGKLFIAGAENHEGIYKCGVSYELSRKSPASFIYTTQSGDWQVEFTTKSTDVVARTTREMSYDEVQSGGFLAIEEALDMFSVKGFSTILKDPTGFSICVYRKDGKTVLTVYSLTDHSIGIVSRVTHTIDPTLDPKSRDEVENEMKSLPPPKPIWNESFRYYRLSQCSNDLFDAYRNLFLAFEALLNAICQKTPREGESKWLERALSEVNTKGGLAHFTPTGSKEDPVSYIVRSQYKNIRCKLLHAKFPHALLPHTQLTPQDVKQAYSELIRIWCHIASKYFRVHVGSGGVVTYNGFSCIWKIGLQSGVSICYTSDASPLTDNDTKVSPSGLPVYEFASSRYAGQVKPGVVRIIGEESITDGSECYKNPIHRVCSMVSSTLCVGIPIESGLTISGVDEWECIQDIRLINSSRPRDEFST